MSLLADIDPLDQQFRNLGLSWLWHPSLSESSGATVLTLLDQCIAGEQAFDILCLEGAVLRGPHGSGRFHVLAGSTIPMMTWLERLAQKARYVVAVGSCAAYGGISAMGHNPTEACGLQFDGDSRGGLLGAHWLSQAGWPVINVAGCPIHPGWLMDVLSGLALNNLHLNDLDSLGRPRGYADQLVHHGCPRNEYYEFKASAVKPGDQGCLMENFGCKGTQAHADCNVRLWHGNGSCLRGGYACIACTDPAFEAPGHPFLQTPKVAGIPIGLPSDMPRAWFVALAALSKSATPPRLRENAIAEQVKIAPAIRKLGGKS
jgi:ferredoxin hydrogenase small subunit